MCPTGMDVVEIRGKEDGRFDYPEEIHCVSFFFCTLCKGRCCLFGVPSAPPRTKDFGIRDTDSVILSRKNRHAGIIFF